MKEEILPSLEIEDLSPDGRGVGFLRANGKKSGRGVPVFVTGALPGQTATCLVIKNKKTFIEAVVHKIEAQTGEFASHACTEASRCGGCPLRALPYARQLEWKEKFVRDALVRIGKFDREAIERISRPIIPSPRTEGFRNKIELAFGHDMNGDIIAGFRKAASREIAPVRSCALVEPAANGIIASIRRFAKNLPHGFARFLILRRGFLAGASEASWLALLQSSKSSPATRELAKDLGARLFEENPALAIFALEETEDRFEHSLPGKRVFVLNRNLENRKSNALFELELSGRRFRLDLSSFFQVNDKSAENLAALVRDFDGAPGGGLLLDPHCGVGAPGLLLAENYDSLIGVDINPMSANLARYNAGGGNREFYAGDSGKIIKKFIRRHPRAILLDPPRAGLNAATLAGVLAANPEKIIYVSCNPATFARDAEKLNSRFELIRLTPVDMFPHTPHAEIASLWTRRSGGVGGGA